MASAQIPLRYRDLFSGSLQFPQGNFPSHGKSAGVDPEIMKTKINDISFLFSNLQQKMNIKLIPPVISKYHFMALPFLRTLYLVHLIGITNMNLEFL